MDVDRVKKLVWKDPIVFMVCIVVLTSPLLPLILYFSPLIICTALCAYTLVSVAPREIESELVEQIVGDRSENVSASKEAAGSPLKSCATWLQWLMAMDDHSDRMNFDNIPSTPLFEVYPLPIIDPPTDQEEYYKSSGEEESIIETFANSTIVVESDDDTLSVVEERCEYFMEGSSSQKLEFCEPHEIKQQAFDIRSELQILVMGFYELLSRKSSEWLSFLYGILGISALRYWCRRAFREEKLHTDIYGPLLISQRITVQLREDSDQQQFLKLAEDCNENIALVEEPGHAESCSKLLNQKEQRENSFQSNSVLRDVCSSENSCTWMENDSALGEETVCLDDMLFNDHRQLAKAYQSRTSDQIVEPRSTILQSRSEKDPFLDASEVIAFKGHACSCDEQQNKEDEFKTTQIVIHESTESEATICAKASSLESLTITQTQATAEIDNTKRSEVESLPTRDNTLAQHQGNVISTVDEYYMKVPVKPWPTVQRVLASRTRESNFPSVMRTGNSLSSGITNLSSSRTLIAIKIKL